MLSRQIVKPANQAVDSAREAGAGVKPGAQAPGNGHHNFQEPATAGESTASCLIVRTTRLNCCHPLRGLEPFPETFLWLAPQALCLTPASRAENPPCAISSAYHAALPPDS